MSKSILYCINNYLYVWLINIKFVNGSLLATYSARGILFTEDKFPLHFRNPSDYSLSLSTSLSLFLFSLSPSLSLSLFSLYLLFLIYKWDPGRSKWKISRPIYLPSLSLSLSLSFCLSYLFLPLISSLILSPNFILI